MRENREHTARLSSAEARAKAPAAKREGAAALAALVRQVLRGATRWGGEFARDR